MSDPDRKLLAVLVDLTASGPSGVRDLRVSTRPGVAAAAVLESLAGAVGADPAATAWCAGARVDPSLAWAQCAVRDGSVLRFGEAADDPPAGTVTLHVVGGPESGRTIVLGRGDYTVGRDDDSDVILRDDAVSRAHAALSVSRDGLRVHDLGSTNGTTVDGAPPGSGPVAEGRTIELGGTVLAVGDDVSATRCRPPEIDPVVIDRPRAPRRPARRWWAWVLPLVVGAAVAWVAHSLLFLLFALTAPLLAATGAAGGRRGRREHRWDVGAFAARVDAALAEEALRRRALLPPPPTIGAVARAGTPRLWERPRDAELVVRVGIAPQPSQVCVRDGTAEHPAATLQGMPLRVPVDRLALVGPGSESLARWIVVQLAVSRAPADLAVALIVDGTPATAWSWLRWLPHLRWHAVTARERDSLLAEVSLSAASRSGPRPVVVVASGHASDAGLDRLAAAGVAVVWVGAEDAPPWCTTVVRCRDGAGGSVGVTGGGEHRATTWGAADAVPAEFAEGVARSLAGRVQVTHEAGSEAELVDLLGLRPLTTARIARAWSESNGVPSTVLGSGVAGPVAVDLEADGPHALVAGTTGAGKSRLLQTLVAGLAALHPPDEISFLLIDYKGGAAFAECVRLPHVTGLVTDLDPALTRRALRSLDAEVRRREVLLAAAHADSFAAFVRGGCPGGALARLVIVVDEFATLVEELPDFVRGLVSVARRGRSLGLHLVLATQRPGTAVNAELRANTDLRIALRVTGAAESVDILDGPEAAALPRSAPGSALLRRQGRMIGFRTALPGAGDPAAATVVPLDEWRRPRPGRADDRGRDGLAVLVDTVAAAARASGRNPAPRAWHPPLPRSLGHGEVAHGPSAGVAVGLLDRPDEQAQVPLTVDPTRGGSLLVIGMPGSGRSTTLAVLGLAAAAALPPSRLPLYVVDSAGGTLAADTDGLPHTTACLAGADHHDATALLRRLPPSAPGLLLVDGLDALLAADDSGELARELERLLRGGAGACLHVVASGGRGLLTARATAAFEQRWLLRLADRGDYAVAGVPPDAAPADPPPGRGVRSTDAAEFQVAFPDAALRAAARAHSGRPPATAVRLRPLPLTVTLTELPRRDGLVTLGVAGDDGAPVQLAPFTPEPVRLLVAGPSGSGRSTVLETLRAEGHRLGLQVVVAAPARSPLAATDADSPGRPTLLRPGDDPGDPPTSAALLLVDHAEAFAATRSEDVLCHWLSSPALAAAVTVSSDDPTTPHRGLGARIRSHGSGVLLSPGPVDGHLLGVRLPDTTRGRSYPGRGVVVGVPATTGTSPPAPTVRAFQAALPC